MTARKTVLRTLAFADAFDMPLTLFEAWKFLLSDQQPTTNNQQLSFSDVLRELEELKRDGKIGEETGFYFLAGRSVLVVERLRNIALASWKLKRARRWATWIARLPYVRGVFAHGSLAMEHTREDSDLDVLVVVAPGRMFIARLLVSWLTEMFGVRRSGSSIRDQICLNHYVTESTLAYPYPSAFAAWLWVRIFPLAVRDSQLFSRFQSENSWVQRWLPNSPLPGEVRPIDKQRQTVWVNVIERLLAVLQLRRIAQNPLTQKPGGRIVADTTMLIFNPELPEQRILKNYEGNLARLGLL